MIKIFFLKCFIVSALFFVFSALLLFFGYDFFAAYTSKLYHINAEQYTGVLIYSLAFWKILIIQFTFIPWLVLHCMDCKKPRIKN